MRHYVYKVLRGRVVAVLGRAPTRYKAVQIRDKVRRDLLGDGNPDELEHEVLASPRRMEPGHWVHGSGVRGASADYWRGVAFEARAEREPNTSRETGGPHV